MSRLRKARPWLLSAAVALLAAGGAVRAAVGPAVPVHAAARSPIAHRVVATGRVMPPARVQLGSTVLGRARDVLVAEGDRVKAGQVLIQLDDAEAKAAVAQARAGVAQAGARSTVVRQVTSLVATESLQRARNDLEQAERQHQRMQQLHDSGAVTQEQLDDAWRALENARSQKQAAEAQARSAGPSGGESLAASASLSQAQANLLGAQARLEETRIVASVDGVVLSRTVEPGDVVQPGKVLMVLARDGETQLSAHPDEKNLSALRLGQRAEASADAFPDERFEARIGWIAPAVDPERGTIEVKLSVDHPPAYLRADMTVSINLDIARKPDALVVPPDCVRDLNTDHPWVMLVESSRVVKRPVRLGLRGDAAVEVLDGLEEGRLVVPSSAGPLSLGARIRPRPQAPEAPRGL